MTLYYIGLAKRYNLVTEQQQKERNLKGPHHQKKKKISFCSSSELQRLTGLTIVIILQYIQILNQYFINNVYMYNNVICQLYFNKQVIIKRKKIF